MPIKIILSGFLTVVLALVGLGVWGWYASDDSRAQVARIRAERRLLIFCQEYPGVAGLPEQYAGGPFEVMPPASSGVDGEGAPVTTAPGVTGVPDSTLGSENYPEPDIYTYYGMNVERFFDNAPAGIADEVEVIADADEQASRFGNPEAFSEPEVVTAMARIKQYGERNC